MIFPKMREGEDLLIGQEELRNNCNTREGWI